MTALRVALAQINPTIGDLNGNARKIIDFADRAAAAGAQLIVFPELALTGYGPRDLLERPAFMRAVDEAVAALARSLPAKATCLVGAPTRSAKGASRSLHNSVLVFAGGELSQVLHKRLLPTYDVFDEDRWFEAGSEAGIVTVEGVRVGVTICEDAWNHTPLLPGRSYACDPIADCMRAGAQVLINLSGSPFTREKRLARGEMMASIAKANRVPLIMVNQVGAHDDLIYDGSSLMLGPDGAVWARAKSFGEELLVADLAADGPLATWPASEEDAVIDALVLGIADYARRCGISRAILGLSGGIDSAVVAALAVAALGKDNVLGVAMPSRYSSEGSVVDARALADALGMSFEVVSIEPIFAPYTELLDAPLSKLGEPGAADVTFENIQARLRMTILMALANRQGSLLLTTGNKSEVAVGYCTLYGDMAGGLAVISDLYKTFVYRVARAINARAGSSVIPESTLTKPPSAELRPDQTDQDSLPPYDVLDAILVRHIEGRLDSESLVAEGFDAALVKRVCALVRVSEHKRRQMPPGLIVSSKAFGPGRRVPIAHRWTS